ncbi:MAG: ABC transporter ATP-binding protein [Spirochaetia bacterium]
MNVIEVEDVCFSYRKGEKQVVRNLDFNVAPGEIYGFLGPSGAGKSTTQRILIGLVRGWSGTVKVLGFDPGEAKPDFYRDIGVSFELPNLHPKLTGKENLEFFQAFYNTTREPDELLEMTDLKEFSGMKVESYSKGMKMRLNFCRALLHNPKLLFLDEPTSGLDPVYAQRVKEIIKEERDAGKTIFLTTHNMFVADELCDRVALMVDGKLAAEDTPAALKSDEGSGTVQVKWRGEDRNGEESFNLKDIGRNSRFLRLLRDREIISISTPQPTLEDTFIRITGRSLA